MRVLLSMMAVLLTCSTSILAFGLSAEEVKQHLDREDGVYRQTLSLVKISNKYDLEYIKNENTSYSTCVKLNGGAVAFESIFDSRSAVFFLRHYMNPSNGQIAFDLLGSRGDLESLSLCRTLMINPESESQDRRLIIENIQI